MNREKLNEVLEILSKYNSGQSVVNYYELFGLNKNMSIEELKKQIKQRRLQVLFHPDQVNFIPSEYHAKYLEMVDVVKDAINTFSSYSNKEKYDISLKESIRNNQFNKRDSYYQENNNKKSNGYQEEKTEDLNEVNLATAVIINSQKYGFEFTMNSLVHLVANNEMRGFTRDGGARDLIKNIEREKLLTIINASSLEDTSITIEQIVMNYLTDLLYKMPEYKKQIGLIEQACAATYYKYDMNGYQYQTNNALDRYCNNGNVGGFTNDNNVRFYLDKYGDRKNAEFYIKCTLNNRRMNNPEFSYTSILMKDADYTNAYVEMIHKDLMKNYNTGYNDEFAR